MNHRHASVNMFYEKKAVFKKHFFQVTSSVRWLIIVLFLCIFSTYLNSVPPRKGGQKIAFKYDLVHFRFSRNVSPQRVYKPASVPCCFDLCKQAASLRRSRPANDCLVIFSAVILDLIERDKRSTLIWVPHIDRLKWRASLLKEDLQYQITEIDIVTAASLALEL